MPREIEESKSAVTEETREPAFQPATSQEGQSFVGRLSYYIKGFVELLPRYPQLSLENAKTVLALINYCTEDDLNNNRVTKEIDIILRAISNCPFNSELSTEIQLANNRIHSVEISAPVSNEGLEVEDNSNVHEMVKELRIHILNFSAQKLAHKAKQLRDIPPFSCDQALVDELNQQCADAEAFLEKLGRLTKAQQEIVYAMFLPVDAHQNSTPVYDLMNLCARYNFGDIQQTARTYKNVVAERVNKVMAGLEGHLARLVQIQYITRSEGMDPGIYTEAKRNYENSIIDISGITQSGIDGITRIFPYIKNGKSYKVSYVTEEEYQEHQQSKRLAAALGREISTVVEVKKTGRFNQENIPTLNSTGVKFLHDNPEAAKLLWNELDAPQIANIAIRTSFLLSRAITNPAIGGAAAGAADVIGGELTTTSSSTALATPSGTLEKVIKSARAELEADRQAHEKERREKADIEDNINKVTQIGYRINGWELMPARDLTSLFTRMKVLNNTIEDISNLRKTFPNPYSPQRLQLESSKGKIELMLTGLESMSIKRDFDRKLTRACHPFLDCQPSVECYEGLLRKVSARTQKTEESETQRQNLIGILQAVSKYNVTEETLRSLDEIIASQKKQELEKTATQSIAGAAAGGSIGRSVVQAGEVVEPIKYHAPI